MLGRVLSAIKGSDLGGAIALIGLDDDAGYPSAEAWPDHVRAPSTGGPPASVLNALADGSLSFPALITTCDHALLTSEIVSWFVESAMDMDADLCVGLATRETIEADYPDVSRTFLKLGGREYSACNLFLLKTPTSLNALRFWEKAEADRKRPWRIARRFGISAALKIWSGRVDLEEAFALASERLSLTAKPVLLPFASAAIDVDKPADLALVTEILERQ